MGAFFAFILGIPGLIAGLFKMLLVGGAYGKGRLDQRKTDKLDAAEATSEALQAQKATADSIMRMDEAERRKQLRDRWSDDA